MVVEDISVQLNYVMYDLMYERVVQYTRNDTIRMIACSFRTICAGHEAMVYESCS